MRDHCVMVVAMRSEPGARTAGAFAVTVFLCACGPEPSAFTNQLDALAGAAGGDTRKTAAVAGDASRFDPVAALDQVLALAGPGARLEQLSTSGVRSDGTLDLTATYTPAPRASYTLHREVPAPADAPPLGAGGSRDGRWYQALRVDAYRPGQMRQVTKVGGGIGRRYRYVNRGLDLEVDDVTGEAGEAVPPPACRFDRIWRQAIADGAPADAVAQIGYDARGYSFNIPGVFNRRYGPGCAPPS